MCRKPASAALSTFYPISGSSTPEKGRNARFRSFHDLLSATRRPASAITHAALSATPAVTSQATV
jgi:hypothetical protein